MRQNLDQNCALSLYSNNQYAHSEQWKRMRNLRIPSLYFIPQLHAMHIGSRRFVCWVSKFEKFASYIN